MTNHDELCDAKGCHSSGTDFDYFKDEHGDYRVCHKCGLTQRKVECWQEVKRGF